MSKGIEKAAPIDIAIIEQTIIKGDLSGLNEGQRLEYMKRMADNLGIDILTRPFDLLVNQQSKALQLYSNKNCAEQLRRVHNISITITAREKVGDIYIVTSRATLASGRTDESTGAVDLKGLMGEKLANAIMKCETKSKRRVTNSICGLGMLDETEVEDNPQIFVKVGATPVAAQPKSFETAKGSAREEPKTRPMPPLDANSGDDVVSFGKHKGQQWSTVPADYLQWNIDNSTKAAERCAQEAVRREEAQFQASDGMGDELEEPPVEAYSGILDAEEA